MSNDIDNNRRSFLRLKLTQYFSDEDLKNLCFDLGVDYDNLSGTNKEGKVRELIVSMSRLDRIHELVRACYVVRPNIDWSGSGSQEANEYPEGWGITGNAAKQYEIRVDKEVKFLGKNSLLMKSSSAVGNEFGALVQSIKATNYQGKRVCFAAQICTKDVTEWCGLWLRADGKMSSDGSLAFDNMYDRAIRGTNGWEQYTVVLDLPQESEMILFGLILNGQGQVWISDLSFTAVDDSVPTTSKTYEYPSEPINLSFDL